MKRDHDTHEEFGLSSFQDDKLISGLSRIIRLAVRFLAVLMTFVIVWGVWDVVWVLCERLMAPPFMLLEITDILATFSAFMAVLIAIEIFINIVMYLKDNPTLNQRTYLPLRRLCWRSRSATGCCTRPRRWRGWRRARRKTSAPDQGKWAQACRASYSGEYQMGDV